MVSTRHHPRDFPPATNTRAGTPSRTSGGTASSSKKWVHTPTTAVNLWLLISCPLVLWDAGYVLLRPHSMPGGKWHSPMWSPYALYATVDYIYGWPAYNSNNGFTAAQTYLNLVETAAYLYYLWVVYRHGTPAAGASRGNKSQGLWSVFTGDRVVSGRTGAIALLVVFSASVMTLSKTILYCKRRSTSLGLRVNGYLGVQEYCCGFENIGHNDIWSLIILWIIPNGAWIIFPSWNLHVLGEEIVASLADGGSRQSKGQ
ncbi:hypothetical protein BJX63DRAFT_122029 [Aspergillus granulosus]|uniref:Uncharacterized protein n=1 Tax=Aspergillus granulosus TaxID=176169 RepID=A0ABR4I5C4_9EURO